MSAPDKHCLVLWDIDHTLMETRGLGTQLYRLAFEVATGVTMSHVVDPTGRTELAILAETLKAHGITPSGDFVSRYCDALAHQYEQHVEELRDRGQAMPGARESLVALQALPGVAQTVLTGNLKAVAIAKLAAFGLGQYIDFEIGAYGEDNPERPALVAIAQQRASAKHGASFGRQNTIVIGDTVGDVRAAHKGGAKIVAVATGKDSPQALQEAGAEVILARLDKYGHSRLGAGLQDVVILV